MKSMAGSTSQSHPVQTFCRSHCREMTVKNKNTSRRNFLAGSAAIGATAAFIDAGALAAQTVGVKRSDLNDLVIKEVKIYVTDLKGVPRKLNTTETGELISVVTNNGIEGNYTIGDRNRTEGWLAWA